MYDLIFISLENWDDIWRRNQFVCAELARRHPHMKILFVGLPRNVSNAIRRGRFKNVFEQTNCAIPSFANITVAYPWKLLPDSLPGGRFFNQWLFRWGVRRISRRLGFNRPVLWLNPHYAVHMAGRMGESAIIYDVTDDWTKMKQPARRARLVERQDAALCAGADAVIVCSDRLAELKRPLNPHVHLIPNGVDANHYAAVTQSTELPAMAARWGKPVLGYTGTVHPDRVDVELIRKVAERWPGSVVLVGPDHLSVTDIARLDLQNIHRIGAVAYLDIPAYMQAFDVCIVPHRMSEFTESLNPIKLWEYLAAGKPIVSTDVAGFRKFPKLVRLARTADEFLAAAHAAIDEIATAEGESRRFERQKIARANSWEQRVDEIEHVIDDCVRRRQAASASDPIDCQQMPGVVDVR